MNTLILNRMWKISSLADVDLDTLVARPNGFILTDQMDGVEALRNRKFRTPRGNCLP
ncbi:MAG: hypothetical protein IPJ00_21180 [Saprospirales bacterium]|nr:hypothetical protein [Saprospirales bacterium]